MSSAVYRAQPGGSPASISFRRVIMRIIGNPDGDVRMRGIVLPTEHGSWGFVFEPIVLGLLVAPSLAGLLLAIAVFGAFLARQPLRIASMDLVKRRRLPRTKVASRVFAIYAGASLLAGAGAIALGGTRFLIPLLLAAPFGAVQIYYDAINRSRSAVAEFLSPIAITSAAAAIAIAGSVPVATAFGLWALLVGRALPSIAYVRSRLRLERGAASDFAEVVGAHAAAVAIGVFLASAGVSSYLAVAALALLLVRAAHGLSRFRTTMSARAVGFTEVGFGTITVFAIAAGCVFGM